MSDSLRKIKRIGHLALFVDDPDFSARWYADVLGMRVVAVAGEGPYHGGIFMSFGKSDHDIGLFKRRGEGGHGREFEHVGLELDCGADLACLQEFYGSLIRKNVRLHEILDHGVSKGVYFFDPDGHLLEVYCQQMHGRAARAELARNRGMATPYPLKPLP